MIYRVEVAVAVEESLLDQARYIRDKTQSVEIGERWLNRIYDEIASLKQFPRRCSLAEENESRSYEIRRLIVGNHVLLFTVEDQTACVHVIGFRHGAQLPRPDQLPSDIPAE